MFQPQEEALRIKVIQDRKIITYGLGEQLACIIGDCYSEPVSYIDNACKEHYRNESFDLIGTSYINEIEQRRFVLIMSEIEGRLYSCLAVMEGVFAAGVIVQIDGQFRASKGIARKYFNSFVYGMLKGCNLSTITHSLSDLGPFYSPSQFVFFNGYTERVTVIKRAVLPNRPLRTIPEIAAYCMGEIQSIMELLVLLLGILERRVVTHCKSDKKIERDREMGVKMASLISNIKFLQTKMEKAFDLLSKMNV